MSLPPAQHMMLGLGAALLTVSLHCLVFGIFTGSGKDTRELVQDLKLSTDFIAKTKAFKRELFPRALYSILFLLLTTSLGGAVAVFQGNSFLVWAHLFVAWFTFFYNVKTFVLESRAVRRNAFIVSDLNREASRSLISNESVSLTEVKEWGEHAYALGKFMRFLGYNVWLVYIYLRLIMGYIMMPWWPFLAMSFLLLGSGFYLRYRYRDFRPTLAKKSAEELRPLQA